MLLLPFTMLINVLTIFNSSILMSISLVLYYVYTNREKILEIIKNFISKLIDNIKPNASVMISRYYDDNKDDKLFQGLDLTLFS